MPCKHNGTCHVKKSPGALDSYTCECTPARSGRNCELPNPCQFNPCKNGAVCELTPSYDPKCNCGPNFTGSFCEVSRDDTCTLCHNGGTCFRQVTPANEVLNFCKCRANFFGRYCQLGLTRQTCSQTDTDPVVCSFYKAVNFCSYKYALGFVPIPVYCPRSCGLCQNGLSCVDEQVNCKIWSVLGLCEKANAINANMCRKSCKNCI